MAALDILEAPTPTTRTSGPQNVSIAFSSVSAGQLLLFALNVDSGSAAVTPPAGLTLLTNKSGWPRLLTYARVVQSGDDTAWQWDTDTDTALVLHAWRIDGPFTDLSGVTGGEDAEFSGQVSRRILLSDVAVAANTLVFAIVGKYNQNALTFSNSFTSAVSTNASTTSQISSARRLYVGAASDVSTTASWTGSTDGAAALIRIAAPIILPATPTPYRHTGLVAGATSVSHYVNLRTEAGAAATGLTYATSGLVASYTRTGATRAAITLATQTPTGSWSSGGLAEVSSANAPGLYRIDIPNAALAAGAAGVVLSIKGTGLQPYHAFLPLEVSTETANGTASGTPTTTNFAFAGLTTTNGALARRLVQFVEGPAAGERVLIVANSTSAIQVAPPFTAAPVSGNRFVLI